MGAATNGKVTFAGLVGGRIYVVVRAHADRRLRVTYGGLASLAVEQGQVVRTGESVGIAADTLFFGVRIGDHHVDPAPFTRVQSTPGGTTSAALANPVRPRFRVTLGSTPARACAN